MRRRALLAGCAGLTALAAGGTAGITFRWHATPRREPFLTKTHLQELTQLAPTPARVLFVGNSMTLRHDLPGRIRGLAEGAGQALQMATAAANGARLIETWSIGAFRDALELGWDILVLQDFSTTCLRAPDRWGSGFAMRSMVKAARAQGVLLYPTWAFPPRHGVYNGEAGLLARLPEDPTAFARAIMDHYGRLADAEGWRHAPVTNVMLPDATPWLEGDLHHLNPQGADYVARILWQELQILLSSAL